MKYSKALASLTLIAAAVASSGVQADTVHNMGTLTPGFTTEFSANWSPVAFTDTFNFTISSASNVFASVNDFPVTLYSFNIYNNDKLAMSLNGGASIGDGQSTTAYNLVAGSYSAVVTGNAVGLNGGIYAVSMSAQPVPVPAAAWLLGSGLLGLVGIARRKEVA